MTNKMTNRKALAYVLENMAEMPEDVRNKLEAMAAALDNKSANVKRKPTKTQVENEALRASIMTFLRENPNLFVTCTDLGKKVAALDGLNNQKISALMKPLVEGGEVVKVTDKGKSLFQLAKPDADEDADMEDGDEG